MHSHRPRVLIIGHSFVRRLQEALHSPNNPDLAPDMKLSQCDVFLFGIGGLKISSAPAFLGRVKTVLEDKRPDICILQIGENDLCSHTVRPLSLASTIDDVACSLLSDFQVSVVYVSQLFTRPSPRSITLDEYLTRRDDTNHYLEVMLASHSRVFYWTHKRMFHSPLLIFARDGVHLNPVGTRKFFKSLRQAIIFAVEKFNAAVC